MDITNQTEQPEQTEQTKQTKQMFAELFENVISCYTWMNTNTNSVSDENKQIVEGFRTRFKNTMHDALTNNNINEIVEFNSSVIEFMEGHNIPVSTLKPEVHNSYPGGRRRKSASSSRPRRRSSKKRGTQRKQKRRQRRGSRRAY
jgi:hypothetical protein